MASLTESEAFVQSSLKFDMDISSTSGFSSKFADVSFPSSSITYDSNLTNTLTRQIDALPKDVVGINQGGSTLSGQASTTVFGKPTKIIPRGEMKAIVTDYITPTMIELEIWSGEVVGKQLSGTIARSLKAQVKKKYKSKNDGSWADNAPGWKHTKLRDYHIRRVMHLHDNFPQDAYVPGEYLSKTVKGFGQLISVKPAGDNTFVITGLDEEFRYNPYVWLHETGTGSFPARPFITPAMQMATEEGMRVVTRRQPIEKLKLGMTKPMKYTMGDSTYQLQIQKGVKRSEEDMLMWMWWFLPQVDELRHLGLVHDVVGYMSGHFIDTAVLTNFAQSLALGKAGMMTGMPVSSKLARRASRKAIWGSQSVSIVRGA